MNTPPKLKYDGIMTLYDRDDWATWFYQIHARAVAHDVWIYFKPDGPLPFPAEPAIPKHPKLSGYPPARGIKKANFPSDLSAEGRDALNKDVEHYSRLCDVYELDYDAWKREKDDILHVTQLISLTVAPHLQHTCSRYKTRAHDGSPNSNSNLGSTIMLNRIQHSN
ncbi:hypothetical protein E4U22_004584 [Claviceps purpurea]|nr:hypothetical protein E4U22_004584 [Claviceps purpurea]